MNHVAVTGELRVVDESYLKPAPEEGVELYTSPWVGGTKAAVYFGPIISEIFIPDEEDWTNATARLYESLREKARLLGANAVVGIESSVDPFATRDGVSGLLYRAGGTAAVLEPL